ncbi:MAG: FAD-binding protein, partial [Burkholderiaceae bacterium]
MQSPAIPPSTERREGVVIEHDVNLKPYNTFGLPATARRLVRIREELDVRRVVDHPELGRAPKFVLGGGSNLVLTKDVDAVVLKMEIQGLAVEEREDCWIVEAGAGVPWHEAVAWSLAQGV